MPTRTPLRLKLVAADHRWQFLVETRPEVVSQNPAVVLPDGEARRARLTQRTDMLRLALYTQPRSDPDKQR